MARNKYPEITVERILNVSERLFFEKGYENTTIADIVKELGDLSKGAIYHHFKSKDDILEAIHENLYHGIDVQLPVILNSTSLNALEKIQETIFFSLKNPAQYRMIELAPNVFKNPRFLSEQLYSSAYEVTPMLEKLFLEGLKDGSISPASPKVLAQFSSIMLNVWMNPLMFIETQEGLRNKFVFLKELFEHLGIPVLTEEMYQIIEGYREKILETQERKKNAETLSK